MAEKIVNILGIRGIPAAHGGFETFAAQLAPYLRDRGWAVNVYCQLDPDENGNRAADFEDDWNGIHRINFSSGSASSLGSIQFDWRCVVDAMKRPGVNLVLGYNTAIFSALLRLRGRPVAMNMDGIEWKRAKWSMPIKAWFYFNEFIGVNAANVAIADHPEIARHLRRHSWRDVTVIPYSSDVVRDRPVTAVEAMGLTRGGYLISIARIEPENSILEIVQAFSAKPRPIKLVVLGNFRDDNAYHQRVKAAASADVMFPGAIYDKDVVAALRYHALAYLHGHQVGGTNPSLVEALGAGNAVIAHDNRFNRWVAGPQQTFFDSEEALEVILSQTFDDAWRAEKGAAASRRHKEAFTSDLVLGAYEELLGSVSNHNAKLDNA